MKNFAMTGVAGYVAPRHLQAIRDTGNRLLAALDPHDSVGILDRYHPGAAFFTEYERFDRHLEVLRRGDEKRIDYLAICSPNHLHDAHIRLALRLGADAICEKPLVLNPWNLDALARLEEESGRRVKTVLQLRVHPALVELRRSLAGDTGRRRVKLTYITPRGPWYRYSWKGDEKRSGGVITNVGIHLFDLLIWLFGPVGESRLLQRDAQRASGELELATADVDWFLSIDAADLPGASRDDRTHLQSGTTHRSLTIDGREVDFTHGFTDLHTRVYEEILAGGGTGIDDARPSVEMVHALRETRPVVG